MATHSSVLAWRIPGTGEPGVLWSWGSLCDPIDWAAVYGVAQSRTRLKRLSSSSSSIVIQTVKGFAIVNKAEIDVFLELS